MTISCTVDRKRVVISKVDIRDQLVELIDTRPRHRRGMHDSLVKYVASQESDEKKRRAIPSDYVRGK